MGFIHGGAVGADEDHLLGTSCMGAEHGVGEAGAEITGPLFFKKQRSEPVAHLGFGAAFMGDDQTDPAGGTKRPGATDDLLGHALVEVSGTCCAERGDEPGFGFAWLGPTGE
jgi:hypothetical protein